MSATEAALSAPRVVLLARPGAAREQLRGALLGAGARIALEDDPNSLDADTLAASRPQVVLVALEPAIEDALARLEAVLADPGPDRDLRRGRAGQRARGLGRAALGASPARQAAWPPRRAAAGRGDRTAAGARTRPPAGAGTAARRRAAGAASGRGRRAVGRAAGRSGPERADGRARGVGRPNRRRWHADCAAFARVLVVGGCAGSAARRSRPGHAAAAGARGRGRRRTAGRCVRHRPGQLDAARDADAPGAGRHARAGAARTDRAGRGGACRLRPKRRRRRRGPRSARSRWSRISRSRCRRSARRPNRRRCRRGSAI